MALRNPAAARGVGSGISNVKPKPSGTRSTVPETWTSTDPLDSILESLPSLAALQSWVQRPQAIAQCFIKDVIDLRVLAHNDGNVSHASRGVFLLDHFPCRVVEVVAWVAGVVHKDSTMTVTLDEGNGICVLEAVVRLPPLELPKKRKREEETTGTMFKSAAERRKERLTDAPCPSRTENVKVYIRPDIRIGDTVRVVGQVNEWARGGKHLVRQLAVNEGSGLGSIMVVDPDEEYAHIDTVRSLHQTRYSQPFVLPTPGPSPTKSILSSVASDLDDDDEEDLEPDLPDPSLLSNSRLTEHTFKRYALDYMTRETTKTMRSLRDRRRYLLSEEPITALYVLFPEYRKATEVYLTRSAARGTRSRTFSAPVVRPLAQPTLTLANDVMNDATPRATATFRSKPERDNTTFRSKSERDACVAAKKSVPSHPVNDKTPVARTFRARAEREAIAAATKSKPSSLDPGNPDSQPSSQGASAALSAFTVPNLLAIATLGDLAAQVVDMRARNEEKERRWRKKHGTTTERDLKVVADRRSRGLEETSYKLSPADRQKKITALAEWAIRSAHAEGGLIEIKMEVAGQPENTWRRRKDTVTGYLPLPPDLLAPLIAPVVSVMKARQRGTFRSRLERAAHNLTTRRAGVDAASIKARLQGWGEEGRWERVGLRAIEAALEWGEAQGLLDL